MYPYESYFLSKSTSFFFFYPSCWFSLRIQITKTTINYFIHKNHLKNQICNCFLLLLFADNLLLSSIISPTTTKFQIFKYTQHLRHICLEYLRLSNGTNDRIRWRRFRRNTTFTNRRINCLTFSCIVVKLVS